jgi:hypothetical protein
LRFDRELRGALPGLCLRGSLRAFSDPGPRSRRGEKAAGANAASAVSALHGDGGVGRLALDKIAGNRLDLRGSIGCYSLKKSALLEMAVCGHQGSCGVYLQGLVRVCHVPRPALTKLTNAS